MSRYKDWLTYSEELLEIADFLIEKGKYSWACFTLHQASTAALKAILAKNDESTYGENLINFLRTIDKQFQPVEEVKKACRQINDYFQKTRDLESNPIGTPLSNFTINDAKLAKSNTLTILRFAHHSVFEK